MTRFRDIQGFVRARYEVDVGIGDIVGWFERQQPNMDPPFQRAHVWTEAQQIAFVEFILRGGSSGRNIYFNHPGWFRDWTGSMVVVDGKQRLQACLRFMHDEIPAFGHTLSEYEDEPDWVRMRLRFHVHDLEDPADVLRWYLELNDGGTPHTPEEIQKVRDMLKARSEGGGGS